MNPETIYRTGDDTKKVLTIEEVFALKKGEHLTWEPSEGPRESGPLVERPNVGAYVKKGTDEVYAYAMFTLDYEEENWSEFIEAYYLGKDGEPSTVSKLGELKRIYEEAR